MGVQILLIFRARLPLHQRHLVLKWHRLSIQTFDRDRLDEPPGLPDVKALLGGVDPARDPLARQASAHIIDLAINHEISSGPYRASKGLLIDLHEPAIRIDRLGNSRQRRKRWAGYPRRLVPTGARLVGSLAVVMNQKGLGELRDLREGTWPVHLQAFLTKRAMKSLHVRIFVWTMRRDHMRDHPKAEQEAHQGGREIPSRSTADKAGVIVKGEHAGQAMLAEKLGYHLEERLGIEIAAHLAVQPDRGASIDEVGDLDHMLLLATGISGYTTGVFEVELDFLPWLAELKRFGLAATMLFDAARLAQDLPDRGRERGRRAPALLSAGSRWT